MSSRSDPYALDRHLIREPPTTLWGCSPFVGPGFVLSAAIVGSGELIATTMLGAKAGFVALWVIVLSCIVKVALQIEFGRHTIAHGQTCMEAINDLPGGKLFGTGWMVWIWLALWPVKILQVGGIVGGVAMLLHMVLPGVSVPAWCWIAAIIVALLVSLERYKMIEKSSLFLIALFTALTLTSVIALAWTPYAASWDDFASGFSFQLPAGSMLVVVGAFGLTGVGGDEIMQYTYWLLEKGYAAYVGPFDGSEAWHRRARGWTRVMMLDALLSMMAYTVTTIAFFVLGAAVLHARGEIPSEDRLIETLASMYTNTLGPWAKWVFLAGAFLVLFSTLFAALAAWTRVFGDAISLPLGLRFRDPSIRRPLVFALAWIFPITWAAVFVGHGKPIHLVLLGGVATTAILLMVVVAALYFRLFATRRGLRPSPWYDLALWTSALSITAFACAAWWHR